MAETIQTPVVPITDLIASEVVGLREREGGLMEGHVPLWMIDIEDVPVNFQNIQILRQQMHEEAHMHGTSGQLRPVFLGIVEGRAKLPIIDGYHRTTIFAEEQRPDIFATLQSVTEEELLDKRIQNTTTHDALQFSRATKWVRQSWALNPYSDRITETQAFVLGRVKASTGKRLGLEPEEVTEIMEWVDAKSMLWGIEPMTVYAYLHTDDNVDQSLVHNSRPNSAQAEGPRSLPHSSLQRIGKQLPGRTELQLVVADVIIDHRLGGSGITAILKDIKGMADGEALAYLDSVDFAAYKEKLANEQVFRYKDSEIVRTDRVRESSRVRPLDDIAAVTGIKVDFLLDEGDTDPNVLQSISRDLRRIGEELIERSKLVDTALEGANGPVVKEGEVRDIKEFSRNVAEFLLDPEVQLDIQTDREADLAERTINRGRGRAESITRLEEMIERYRSSKQ